MNAAPGKLVDQPLADVRRQLRRKRILDGAKTRLEKLNGKTDGNAPEIVRYSDPEVEPNVPGGKYSLNEFFDATPKKKLPLQFCFTNIIFENRMHIFLSSGIAFALSLYIKTNNLLYVGIIMLELTLLRPQCRNKIFVNQVLPVLPIFIDTKLSQRITKFISLLWMMKFLLNDFAISIFVICVGSCILPKVSDTYIITVK
ncbi:uncharacterized protein LOC6649968 [Drosophila willistoni]|uniref:uncharacterized protein LOC6649968 n=1 Tax=Drosophila willistoni TaxID=7260 RepID=UPI001F078122|nr:uncharacterized protein LOC6649968 [Drosophila willistoni]